MAAARESPAGRKQILIPWVPSVIDSISSPAPLFPDCGARRLAEIITQEVCAQAGSWWQRPDLLNSDTETTGLKLEDKFVR